MTPVPVFETLSSILVSKFEVPAERIQESALLEDLGLDSLALMEFVFALEDAFSLRIPEEKLDPTQSGMNLGQLSAIVSEALAATAS